MAISGSTDFTATRNQIIRAAALNVNAISQGVTMGADLISDFAFALNAMVKGWQETGIQIWTEKEATLFPTVGQTSYAMGSAATDHVTESYVQSTLSVVAALGDTTLSVTDPSSVSVADHFAVQLDDGSLFWSTVLSKTTTTVTIAAPLTDSAAAANYVFAYTRRIVRPLGIIDVRRYNIASASDTPLGHPISRSDYQMLPRKASTGIISHTWYDQQTVTGRLYVWQPPEVIEDLLKFTWLKPIDDFDSAADEPDMPQGWISTLIWNLSLEMTVRYPVAPNIYNRIVERAADTFDQVSSFDREGGSVFFQPARR